MNEVRWKKVYTSKVPRLLTLRPKVGCTSIKIFDSRFDTQFLKVWCIERTIEGSIHKRGGVWLDSNED